MRAHVNSTELYFSTHGQGAPMLVMHGGLGFDHTYLRSGLDPLGDVLQLLYYDHRGCGQSPAPAELEAVTHETWADDADELRERLGHEKVLLFGHSYGGFLALEYALRYPERLLGLVLCSTAPAMDYPEAAMANAQARATPEQLQALLAGLSAPAEDDAALEALTRAILPVYFHRPDRGDFAALFGKTRFRADAFNRAFFGCLPAYDVTERLGEIRVPTLVLAGAHDWICPPEHGAERLAAGLPDSELVVFEKSGHYPFSEEPEAFRAAVAGWASRRIRGASPAL